MQAISWRLKTGAFRLRESIMRENPGPPGWGLGTRPTILARRIVAAMKPQIDIDRWIFERRQLQRPRTLNEKKVTNVYNWKELALNRKACNDLAEKTNTHNG
jgi:hypothetical protein